MEISLFKTKDCLWNHHQKITQMILREGERGLREHILQISINNNNCHTYLARVNSRIVYPKISKNKNKKEDWSNIVYENAYTCHTRGLSLHFCFLKQNMTIHSRVIFPKLQLLRHLGWLPLNVKEPSPSSWDKTDEGCRSLLLVTHF